MTSEELYYKFKLLYNKGNESEETFIRKQDFVMIYNKEAEAWLSDFLKLNRRNSEIIKINELLSSDVKLSEVSISKEKTEYLLPDDFFDLDLGSVKSKISSPCSVVIYNNIYKTSDLNLVLKNKFLSPSVAWERGVATVSGNKLQVYTTNFKIDKTTISYYRKLKPIDLKGYIKEDNTPSKNINPDYSDYIAHEILDRVVTEFNRIYPNEAGFSLSKDRQNNVV